jgi:hypothetical protein
MENKFELLVPGEIYHLYNRANGNDGIFCQRRIIDFSSCNLDFTFYQLRKFIVIA